MIETTTHIKTDKQLVPALRFKEFDKSWNLSEVNEECKIYDGTHQTPKYVEEGVPFYSVEHVTSNNFEKTKFISEEVFQKECKRVTLTKGDVLMTRIGDVGTPKLIDWDVRASFYVSLALFKITSENLNSKFLACCIESIPFQKEIWRRMIHVAFPKKINLGEIGICKFNLPSLPEQQKIASFLSAVDEKIQQLTKKAALLEQYKKGVMQQLFSGQLRFKDENGNAYPDWEEKKLGDVGKIKMCKRIFSQQTTEIGDIPFYKIGTFGKEADAYITMELFLEFKKKYSYPKVGEILMSASGTLGRTVIYDGREAYYQDSNIVWIENNEELITNEFLFYVYQVVRYQSEGGTIQRLYNSIISAAKFLKPSLEEQHKVTNLLSSIDTKIESVNNQITQTQTFKKGLLQQMFVAA